MKATELKNRILSDYNNANLNKRKSAFLRIADLMKINLPSLQKQNPSCKGMYQAFLEGDFNQLYVFFTDPFSGLEHIEENLFYNITFTCGLTGKYIGF